MPEGDTIWRTARTLDGVLSGRVITRFTSPLPAVAGAARRLGVVGQKVQGEQARSTYFCPTCQGSPRPLGRDERAA
jgi:formamidopyrimidine-DNA glycosylase